MGALLSVIGGFLAVLIGGSIWGGAAGGAAHSATQSSAKVNNRHQRAARDVPELDRAVRTCKLYLYTKPLEIIDAPIIVSSFQHWALVAYFEEDELFRVIEGLENGNGRLDAYIWKGNPIKVENEKYYDLGNVDISPAQLRELALNNSLNGTRYCPTTNSCQHWLKKYAELISDDIGKKVSQFWTLTEVNPIFAYSWKYTNQCISFSSSARQNTH